MPLAPNPDAVWTDCLQAVETGINALNLVYTPSGGATTALPTSQVQVLKVPVELSPTETFPLIWVCLGGKEEHAAGDFEDRQRKYPVLILVFFASNQDRTLNNDALYWIQQIVDMLEDFETTIRPEVSSADVNGVDIVPDVAVNPELWKGANVDAGGVLGTFDTLRSRGRG